MAWWQVLTGLGYPGIFLISFIGASSIVFPIPYQTALLAAGYTGYFNTVLLAIFSALGAGLGELVGYGAGYAGRGFVSDEREEQFNAMLKIFNRYGVPAIFVFALTPLPDDLLFIPLGIARYNFWKAFLPCVAGKFLMSLILIKVGSIAGLVSGGGWLSAIGTLVFLILVIYLIFRADWVDIANRIVPSESEDMKNN